MRDLSDHKQPVLRQADNVRRTNSRTRAQSTSVDRGAFRIKSPEGMEVGTEEDPSGTGTVWGTWNIRGLLQLLGNMVAEGIITVTDGAIVVNGTVPITLRQHTDGTARIEFGDPETRIQALDGAIMTRSGDATSYVADDEAGMTNGVRTISVTSSDTYIAGLSAPPPSATGLRYVVVDDQGKAYIGSAGGGGGEPGDPPAGNPEGYIWPADPAVYGISDDFAAHIARGSAEPGVDVMTPVGTPLWAPAGGTIVAVNTAPSGATGRYVTLVTDAGDWFRILHLSAVSVTVGQTVSQTDLLGYTGGSGFGSEAYYGPHAHISFAVGYTGTFPGASELDDFEAYMLAA